MRLSARLACWSLILGTASLLYAKSPEERYRALEDRFFEQKLESADDLKPSELQRARAMKAELEKVPGAQLSPQALLDRDLLVWHLEKRIAVTLRFHGQPKEPVAADPRAPRGPPDDARDRFALRLKYEFGVDFTPEELLTRGFQFWDTTLAELKETCRAIDPDHDWKQVMESLKDDHPRAQDLLKTGTEQMERAIRFVEKNRLVTLPDYARNVQTKWGDPKATTPFGHYLPAGGDGAGHYVIIPINPDLSKAEQEARLRANNVHWTRCVALHEAIPGHHLQFSVAGHSASRVEKIFYNTAFVEGWGLYCEGMMARNGYFADPKDRASQLKMRLWRAGRVIIDVGTHLGGMTKDEGVRLLVDGVGMEAPCARDEVQRYIDSPLYYSGYMVGCLQMEEMRDAEEKRLGARFDQRAFHDRLLAHGPIPFRFVRRAVLGE